MCLGEIVWLEAVSGRTATGRVGDRQVTVSLLTLDGTAGPGDWVVVHSGFALERLDPAEAAQAVALRSTEAPPRPTHHHPQEES
jgi:hydrogenase expression/formation protein HypC